LPYKDLEKRRECAKLSMRRQRHKNPEKFREIARRANQKRKENGYYQRYAETHQEQLRAYRKLHWAKNKDRISQRRKEMGEIYLIYMREQIKKSEEKLRIEVLSHYSNGAMKCQCCGEQNILFLTLDHINNDGAKERKSLGWRGNGIAFYRLLKKLGFPDGYQVLCMNCNFAKMRTGGICPHKAIKVLNVESPISMLEDIEVIE